MASQISGSVGAANANAIISAFKLDGRLNVGNYGSVAQSSGTLTTQAVASGTGAYTIGGLAAGTYLLVCTLTNNPPGRPGGIPVEPGANVGIFAVDGSTSYSI